MTTLSDIASPEAQGDLQELLNTLYGAAQQHMAKRGEFFPFAAGVGFDGDVELIAAVPNLHDDRPPSADVLDACHEALVSKKGALRSGGIVSDVRAIEYADLSIMAGRRRIRVWRETTKRSGRRRRPRSSPSPPKPSATP
jgi:hypothetical protein